MSEEEVFVIGKVHLNPEQEGGVFPFLEIMMDTAGGRYDRELVLLRQIKSK